MSVLKRDFAAVLLWGLLLGGLTAAQLVFMEETYSYGLLGGAALATFLLGVFLLARRRPGEAQRLVPDSSYPVVAVGVGVALAVVGTPFGAWLVLPGLGLAGLGAGGLVREYRAERRGPRA
jgi:hypothetical protein